MAKTTYGKWVFKDSDQTIIRIINEAFIKKLEKNFYSPSVSKKIEDAVKPVIINKIRNSKTWQSLADGGQKGLDAHFGIPKGELHSRLENIMREWEKQIFVKPITIKRRPNSFILSYGIFAIYSDWEQVLSLPDGITINDSRNAKRGKTEKEIPWLNWLLIGGDKVQIEGYSILYGNFSASRSRSGKAIMIPKLSWRIPTGYGPFNKNNNFVTRALQEIIDNNEIKSELTQILETATHAALLGI